MQRLVDAAPLFQTFTIGLLCAFGTRQIDKVEATGLNIDDAILNCLGLDEHAEHRMRPRAGFIVACRTNVSTLRTTSEDLHSFLAATHSLFGESLNVHSLLQIFAQLQIRIGLIKLS